MPHERFEGEEDAVRAPVNPDELRLVLHDLTCNVVEEERAAHDLPDEHVTALAIAETLDLPLEQVYEAIARVRRQDVREHVSKVLSELEEPTHRVERPSPTTRDPLIGHYGFRRENVFSSVLDKLPKHGQKKLGTKMEQRPKKPTVDSRVVLLLVAFAGIIAVTAYTVVQIVQMLR